MGRPWLVVGVLAAGVFVLGHRAPFIQQDHSPERIFGANEQARKIYGEFVSAFGSDEVVLVQLRGASPERGEHLLAVADLSRRLSRVAGVRHVTSPSDLLPRDAESLEPEEVEAVVRQLEAIPLFRALGLYLPDLPSLGAAASIVMNGAQDRTRFNEDLQAIAARFDAAGFSTVYAGLTPANAAIDRETRETLGLFLPLVVLAILIIGLVIFRSWKVLPAMLLPPGGAVILGASGLAMAGVPIDLATGVMPPLVLAIGFAGTIHLVSYYGAALSRGGTPAQAVVSTVRHKAVPTFFAFGTTALGFGSLALSLSPSIRALGLASGGAILAAAVLVTLGTPALLALARPVIHSPSYRRGLVERVARWSLSRRPWVLAGTVPLLLLVALGLTRLTTTIDGVKLLGEDVPERRAFERVESGGTGLATIEVWIRKASPDEATLLADARRLEEVAGLVSRLPLVTGSLGPHDLLKAFNVVTAGRAELPEGLAALELADAGDREDFERSLGFFRNTGEGYRLTVFSRTGDEAGVEDQLRRIRLAAETVFPGTPVDVTGHFVMLIETPGMLMRTLYLSLLTTVGIITLVLLAVFRSFRTVLGALVVNLMPVGLVVAAMGWLGISVDVATVMTASVAYGLAVDDTYHFLHHHRESGDVFSAARIVGQGIVGTTLAVGCGFLVLALSGFNPVVRFGSFTALALVLALGSDMLLLPVILGKSRFVRQRGSS